MNNPPGAYLQKNLQMWILLEVKGLLGGIIKKGFFLKNTSIKGKGLYEGGDYSRKYDT